MSQLFEELKRRNVFRVVMAYLAAGWLVLQVAQLVLKVAPNYAKLIQEAELPWPPLSPIDWPLKDW